MSQEKIELFRKELDYLEQNYLSLKKEDILKKLEEIELFYKYSNVSFNEYKRFYEFKFKLLTSNFLNELILMDNPNTISPFQNIEDKHILKYYKDIITSILENVLKGNENTLISLIKNPRIKKEYVEYIQNTLKNKDNVYDYEEILKDKEKLAIILILNQTNIEAYFSFHHFLRNSIWLNWKEDNGMRNEDIFIVKNHLHDIYGKGTLKKEESLEDIFEKMRLFNFFTLPRYTFRETCYLMKEILSYFQFSELLFGKNTIYFEIKKDDISKLNYFFATTFLILKSQLDTYFFNDEEEMDFSKKLDYNLFDNYKDPFVEQEGYFCGRFYFIVRDKFSELAPLPIDKYTFQSLNNVKYRTNDFKPEGKWFNKWEQNIEETKQKVYVEK